MLSDGESVISLDVSLTAIPNLTKNVNLNGEGYGFIVDKTGLVIAHFNEYENGTNLYNKSDEDIVKLVKNIYKNNGGVINMNIDGGDCTIFSKNLMDIGFVVIVMSSDSISQRLHVSLIGNILITVFILFVIIYFCTTTFLAKNQSLEYARQLKDIKDSLEIRVLQ